MYNEETKITDLIRKHLQTKKKKTKMVGAGSKKRKGNEDRADLGQSTINWHKLNKKEEAILS
jgi:hypothetical protein